MAMGENANFCTLLQITEEIYCKGWFAKDLEGLGKLLETANELPEAHPQ